MVLFTVLWNTMLYILCYDPLPPYTMVYIPCYDPPPWVSPPIITTFFVPGTGDNPPNEPYGKKKFLEFFMEIWVLMNKVKL